MMKSSKRLRKHEPIPISNSLWSSNAQAPAKRASVTVGRAHKLTVPKRAVPEHLATLVKPSMRFPLATTVLKPALDWKPFFSCLIDTVAVLIDVIFRTLQIVIAVRRICRSGNIYASEPLQGRQVV